MTNAVGEPTSSVGTIQIDRADFSTDLIVDVVKHEIAHLLGFGALFNANDLVSGPGEYTGAEVLAAYRAEFSERANYIPLEDNNAHYIESDFLLDVTRQFRLGNELLTPFIEDTPNAENFRLNFLSQTSLRVFRDLGYNAGNAVAVPEPSAIALLTLGGLSACSRRVRISTRF